MIPNVQGLALVLCGFALLAAWFLWAVESCRHVCPCTSDDECDHDCTCGGEL
mgnify:FL=1